MYSEQRNKKHGERKKKPCFVEFHTARDGWEILEFA
jgi:hypothetical protein